MQKYNTKSENPNKTAEKNPVLKHIFKTPDKTLQNSGPGTKQNSFQKSPKKQPNNQPKNRRLGHTADYSAKHNHNEIQRDGGLKDAPIGQNLSANQSNKEVQELREIAAVRKYESIKLLQSSEIYTPYNPKKPTYPRIFHCGRTPFIKESNIEFVTGEKGNNYFQGLQQCGSFWVCPDCYYKIAKKRTGIVYKALEKYKKYGYNIYFLTLTFPHYKSDRLNNNLKFLISGWNYINTHRDKIENLNYEFVRAIEPTFGSNSWHPHLHIVIVTKQTIPEIENILKPLWHKRIINKLDNRKGNEHAFKLQSWDGNSKKLSDYLFNNKGIEVTTEDTDKWTLAKEVVKGHTKKGNRGNKPSYTPFDMLDLISTGEKPLFNFNPGRRFIEFAEHFKGKQAYSRSNDFLKKLKKLDDDHETMKIIMEEKQTDESIVKDDKAVEILYTIESQAWKQVIKHNLKVKLINAFENGGLQEVKSVLFKANKRFTFENNIVFFVQLE